MSSLRKHSASYIKVTKQINILGYDTMDILLMTPNYQDDKTWKIQFFPYITVCLLVNGQAVVQLFEALYDRPKGRGLNFRWVLCGFSFTYSFPPQFDPSVDSASNRMITSTISLGGEGGRCLGLTTLPYLCADCLETLGASTCWRPKGLPRPAQGLF